MGICVIFNIELSQKDIVVLHIKIAEHLNSYFKFKANGNRFHVDVNCSKLFFYLYFRWQSMINFGDMGKKSPFVVISQMDG